MNHNHIVIMAGGIGSRFWPISTPDYPKQFIDVLGVGRTLIQMTFDRFEGIVPAGNVWVVTNEKYVPIVREQLPLIPAENILPEPAARNTAPCIAWACWSIRKEDPKANIVVTPSDAVVMNPQEFQRVINNALSFTADKNAIVTIGIKPNRPETGYGYVEVAKDSCNSSDSWLEIKKVSEFKEKPDRATAEQYLAAGNYLWNAGIFVWNVQTITDAITKYKPNIAADMDNIAATDDVKGIFPLCEKISIDFAVMEPAAAEGLVYTHPADFGWSDLGNWQSLHEKLMQQAANEQLAVSSEQRKAGHDDNANAYVGNVRFYECKDCVVHTEDAKHVVLQGLEGYIVSEKGGQILVCKRSEEQRIKDFSAK